MTMEWTREQRKSSGACYNCGVPASGRSRCVDCKEKEKQIARQRRVLEISRRIPKTCEHCGINFGVDYKPLGGRPKRFCSDSCRISFRAAQEKALTAPRIAERLRAREATKPCLVCGNQIPFLSTSKTCSSECRYLLIGEQQRGKKKPNPEIQKNCICGRLFTAYRHRRSLCDVCAHARSRGRIERRAKTLGVPYVRGITPTQVFMRDGWRCQLCGIKTPKNLRGTYKANAPEMDHIIPLSKGGGHLWENVQCACRSCNAKKSNRSQGQLRIAM